MNTPLTLIETSDFEADCIVQENQVIDEALHILDRRLFNRGPNLTSPDAVASYLKLHLVQQEHEVFGVIFLDAKHRVLAFEVLFHGSIDGASVYPRQVVKRSLAHNAAAAIFCLPITYQRSDIPLSLLSPHFAAICKCHRNDAHCGDKTPGFVTAAEGFVYRPRW